jgi:Zn-dependent protease
MMDIVITIFSLIVLLFSVIIHELAHGYVANSLGDPTAKYQGRLTLNPLPHLDMFGSVLLPLLLFIAQSPVLVGWAKPVPVNPYNFTDQKWGALKVSLAGPATNLALAVVFGLLMRFLPVAFFITMPGMLIIFSFIVHINIMLAIFNLVPIPPLDGHWILFKFIPYQFENVKVFLNQYGMFLLVFLIFFGGLQWLGAIAEYIFHIITGI